MGGSLDLVILGKRVGRHWIIECVTKSGYATGRRELLGITTDYNLETIYNINVFTGQNIMLAGYTLYGS